MLRDGAMILFVTLPIDHSTFQYSPSGHNQLKGKVYVSPVKNPTVVNYHLPLYDRFRMVMKRRTVK